MEQLPQSPGEVAGVEGMPLGGGGPAPALALSPDGGVSSATATPAAAAAAAATPNDDHDHTGDGDDELASLKREEEAARRDLLARRKAILQQRQQAARSSSSGSESPAAAAAAGGAAQEEAGAPKAPPATASTPKKPQPQQQQQEVRAEAVENAVRFLNHPKVKASPLGKRLAFLEHKGLNDSEIALALKRANISSDDVKLAMDLANNSSNNAGAAATTSSSSSSVTHHDGAPPPTTGCAAAAAAASLLSLTCRVPVPPAVRICGNGVCVCGGQEYLGPLPPRHFRPAPLAPPECRWCSSRSSSRLRAGAGEPELEAPSRSSLSAVPPRSWPRYLPPAPRLPATTARAHVGAPRAH